jgi:hypothetical protein
MLRGKQEQWTDDVVIAKVKATNKEEEEEL